MLMKIRTILRARNLVALGLFFTIIPVALTFKLAGDLEKSKKIFRHSISIQAKLDDFNEHGRDWAAPSIGSTL